VFSFLYKTDIDRSNKRDAPTDVGLAKNRSFVPLCGYAYKCVCYMGVQFNDCQWTDPQAGWLKIV